MSILSLPTCNRCQKRKKKCDKRLPNCTNCEEDGFDCIFFDHGSQQNIPRRYVSALEERVRRLEAEISSQENSQVLSSDPSTASSAKINGFQNTSGALPLTSISLTTYLEDFQKAAGSTSFFVNREPHLTFLGPGSAASIGLSTAMTFETMPQHQNPNGPSLQGIDLQTSETIAVSLREEKLDKSLLDQSLIRELLDTLYFPLIHRRYPLLDPSHLTLDTHLKRLPTRRRLFVILCAAIAAAHQGRSSPKLMTVSLILRHWADELLPEVLSRQDDDGVVVMALLVLFELVEPGRRLIWTLLGHVCRMCIRLGWHRAKEENEDAWSEHTENQTEGKDGEQGIRTYSPGVRRRVFRILYEWEKSVSQALGRPSILPDHIIDPTLGATSSPPSPQEHNFLVLHSQSFLRRRVAQESTNECPLSLSFFTFVNDNLGNSKDYDSHWLLLYPLSRHYCDSCAKNNVWAGQWLPQIEQASLSRITAIYEAHRRGQILSIWLTTTELFTAANVLLDIALHALQEKPGADVPRECAKALSRAGSLLAGFAEVWPGAKSYRDVFDGMAEGVLGR